MLVTFISPYSDITAYGIRILSATMRKANIQTRLIFLSDMDNKNGHSTYGNDVLREVLNLCADSNLIGISLFSCHFPKIADLTERIKKNLSTPIVWGGKHPSAKPEEALKYADIICIGEGETAIVELTQKMENNKPFYDTNNFWFKKNGEIIKNSLRPLTQDLDTLPFPDYSLEEHYIWDKDSAMMLKMDESVFKRFLFKEPDTGLVVYNTLASWGCPYACTYCFSFRDMYKGKRYLRFRSINNIIDEIEGIKNRFFFIGKIILSDDNFFTLKTEDIKAFAKAYKERIGLPIRCLAHPINLTEEKVSIMLDAGLSHIQMGVQTGSEKIKKIYQRNTPNDTILNAVHILNKFKKKIIPSYDFIVDDTYETDEDVVETLRFLLKFPRPYHINVFSLTLYPGTELYNKAVKNGVPFDENKEWEARKKTYLNIIFLLFNSCVPRVILRIMITRPMLKIFGNKFITSFLYQMIALLQKARK